MIHIMDAFKILSKMQKQKIKQQTQTETKNTV